VIKVEANLGPNAAGNFLALARCGYFNNVIFHRILDGFMIQTGDGQYGRLPLLTPEKMGSGGPGYTINDDPIPSNGGADPYPRGTLAMANTGCPNTGSSQLFIVLVDDNGLSSASKSASGCPALQPSPSSGATAPLGNGYAIFGHVTSGMDIVDLIAAVPVGGYDGAAGGKPSTPLVPVVITGTTVTTP
jgi:cyclophilin family peptidyl-prolyl cis-trans isomerase